MNNRLLIIDDNLEIQEANQEYLTNKDYAVDTAYSGAEALALLTEIAKFPFAFYLKCQKIVIML